MGKDKLRPVAKRPAAAEIAALPDNMKVIPPRSKVRPITRKLGRSGRPSTNIYRVGYYSKQDGLNTIWLVDAAGRYCETVDLEHLLENFEIVHLSKEKDYYGKAKRRLGPLGKPARGTKAC